MALIVVGGHTRNIGKTSVVAGLIAAMPERRWTAIKITQFGHGVCSTDGEPCACETADHSVAITQERDSQSGTDSSRYLAAGAERSLWVRTRQGQLAEAMPYLRREFAAPGNYIVESNSLLRFLQPDFFVSLLDLEVQDFKGSALRYLDRADALLVRRGSLVAPVWKGVSPALLIDIPQFPVMDGEFCPTAFIHFVEKSLQPKWEIISAHEKNSYTKGSFAHKLVPKALGPMDIRTLTLVNLIFLFLYAAIMLVHSRMNMGLQGARWFAWSNLSRGVAMLLLSLSALLPKALSSVAGNLLLVVGLLLLHRSLAEVLGRGKTAWNAHLAVTGLVFFGVVTAVAGFGSYTASVMLVSVALSVQMALTAALLVSGLDRSTRVAAYGMSAILFAYALVYMTRAVSLFRHADGALAQISTTVLAVLLVGSLLADAGTAFGFMFLSAAQLRAELTRQAERDALTGLLNRRGLQALAERSLEKSHRAAEPLSAVMLDLDGMKVANDTWGHECGDDLLCKVAKLLVSKVGRLGAVARLGGDEFLVVLPGMAEGGAMEVAEELRSSIEALYVPRCRPRASFGVASMTGISWEEAVRQSDQALYRAKSAGKNRVICFG